MKALKKQIQRLIDDHALEGFSSDGTSEMTLNLPGGSDMDIYIMEDDEGDTFFGISISHPVNN